MYIPRHQWMRWILAAVACAWMAAASAQTAYPAKPVTIFVPWTPGGGSDTLARAVGRVLQETLRQPFVVENRPGANGSIGSAIAARSPGDGYTLLVSVDATFTVNPHLYPKLGFQPSDLKPLVILASSGLVLGTNPALGIKTMEDFIKRGKASGVTLSSGGNGSPGHLAIEKLKQAAGIQVTHVPYKGITPAATAIVSGEVDGGMLGASQMMTQARSGRIVPLAFTGSKPSPVLPDVPTAAALGMPGLQQEILHVLMMPATTPPEVAAVLQKHVLAALAQPQVQEQLRALDLNVEGVVGDAAARRLADLSAAYGRLIRSTGMKIE